MAVPSMLWILLIFVFQANARVHQELSESESPRSHNEELIVSVEQGLVEGRRVHSAAGGSFISFQGIPYAKPPVGPLRFKDAELPLKWGGVHQAFVEGNSCPQTGFGVVGNEDCLYLNVYTPQWPPLHDNPLPVMVWIHGGGFVGGSGHSDLFGPDYLVSEGIILVTINYRLGVLGFLYMNEAAPGNVGLKDQVAALRWVQRNIAAFGGDPDKVTIFGASAGGASVHLHMLSPMSEGLFYSAIAQSGNALNSWAIQSEPLETSRRLATAVGCPVGNDSLTVECLRAVHIDALMEAAFTQSATEKDRKRIALFTFVPTVDLPVPDIETFLPAPAFQLVTEGKHHAVPYLTGFNNNESVLHLFSLNFFDENIAQKLDETWNVTILPELRLPTNGSRNEEALKELRNFYMGGAHLNNATVPGFMNMLSDISFSEGIYYSVQQMAKYNTSPLYAYSFIIDDALNVARALTNVPYLGACHGDDWGYLFHVSFFPDVPPNTSAYVERARLLRLWTNFAKYRNPTPIDDPLLESVWIQYKNTRHFLEIGTELHSETNVNKERVKFWEKFYQTFN